MARGKTFSEAEKRLVIDLADQPVQVTVDAIRNLTGTVRSNASIEQLRSRLRKGGELRDKAEENPSLWALQLRRQQVEKDLARAQAMVTLLEEKRADVLRDLRALMLAEVEAMDAGTLPPASANGDGDVPTRPSAPIEKGGTRSRAKRSPAVARAVGKAAVAATQHLTV